MRGGAHMNAVNYNTVLPKNIYKIIYKKGLKQGAVAERAGYSKQVFNAMLTGRRIIKPNDILAIANALNVEPNDLFKKD